MATVKKRTAKKPAKFKKDKKVSMLDAAIIGASTPTMGKLETDTVAINKTTKPTKGKKISMLDAAIMGASTPTMGQSEIKKKKK